MKNLRALLVLPLLTLACSQREVEAPQVPQGQATAPLAAEDAEPLYRVPLQGLPAIGKDDALVTVVLFEDYECPFCHKVDVVLDELRQSLGDDLRVMVVQHPLPFHKHARGAALAALAAAEQGRFEAMHTRLTALEGKVDDAAIENAAREAGLDMTRFQSDHAGAATANALAAADGLVKQFGANGTPTLFVNGRAIVGSQLALLRTTIGRELESARALVQKGTPRRRVYETLVANGLGQATFDELSKGQVQMVPTNETETARIVRLHSRETRECISAELERSRGTMQSMQLRFTLHVRADGSVSTVDGNPASSVATCIAERARTWTFPPQDKDYEVALPVRFETASGTNTRPQ